MPFDHESDTGSSLNRSYRVLLKAHTTGLATGKNTSLLGMLDQMEMWTCLWLLVQGPQPSYTWAVVNSQEEDYRVLSIIRTEALGEKWHEVSLPLLIKFSMGSDQKLISSQTSHREPLRHPCQITHTGE